MSESVMVAIITASSGIIVASLTFFFTKKHELNVKWQHEKLNHYKVLLSSLSDLAVDGTDKNQANMNFSLAVNTITLVAPQTVVSALMAFHDEVKFSNPDKTQQKHDALLNGLLLAIRKDLGFTVKDDPTTFSFHLIGSAPKGCK